MKNPIKRTKFFVNREIQGRILMRLIKYWVLYNLAIWHGLVLIDFQRFGIAGMLNGGPRVSPVEFYCEFAANHSLLLVLSAAMFPVILWDMVKLTHQVAGPLVRFRNTLHKMTAGEPVKKVELRKGDLLIEFQEAFNEFLESGHLIVNPPQGASDGNPRNSQEAQVLAAVTELGAEVNSQTGEPARSRDSETVCA